MFLVFFNFVLLKNVKEVGMLIVFIRNEFLFLKSVFRDRIVVIFFVDRCVVMEMVEVVRDRWRRREIINFEYLMIFNIFVGRFYNDLI